MRIIGGKHKGRKIHAPKSLPARPTKDVTKEALFNALNNRFYFDEISALDLFAGTGNISFEFASRGTPVITAVDKHRPSLRFIDKTSRQLDFPIQTVAADVKEFLSYPASRAYDVIFMDPPYRMEQDELFRLIDLIFQNGYLAPGGVLVTEHHKQLRTDAHPRHKRTKTYGQSALSFFEHGE